MKLSGNFIISLLILLINILFQNVHSQDISLVFTSSYNDQYLESDSVVIENITQNCDTTLHFPDTVLYLDFTTAVSEHSAKDEIFTLSQNYPNPVSDRCRIELKVFREDIIEISLVNSLGQVLYNTNRKYDMGKHYFSLSPGNERFYFFTAKNKQKTSAIKIFAKPNGNSIFHIEYSEVVFNNNQVQIFENKGNFVFTPGDKLRYLVYAETPDGVIGSDVMEDFPDTSKQYEFEILEGLPCEGLPIFNYYGEKYKTVQIGFYCWFKENLNRSVAGSWCYQDISSNCDVYGRLYSWDVIMNGEASSNSVPSGVQGICPPGWHIPSDAEWNNLVNQLGGFESAGGKMKQTGLLLWSPPNNAATNTSGFTGLPGGGRNEDGSYDYLGDYGCFWTSTEWDFNTDMAWYRWLHNSDPEVGSYYFYKQNGGFSLRCVKDY